MKSTIATSGMLTVAACLLAGCGQSPSSSSDTANTTTANPPRESTPAAASSNAVPMSAPAADSAKSASLPALSSDTVVAATQSAPEVSQFASTAAAQADKTAASIGSDLVAKAGALTQSSQSNPELKSQVGSALQSLSSGKDAGALTTLFQQAKQANLTPQQSQMVKEVSNLASAYVVQRNFASLDGAQGDVATIVNSLRKGPITQAVPALQSLAQNASLTPKQKDLLGTLADQYAPGLKKATDSLKQGLQSVPGFK